MVAGRDNHGVDFVAFFLDQFAVVRVERGVFEPCFRSIEIIAVDVAESDDVFTLDSTNVG